MAAADHIIVGSGINALVAAALLGRKGHRVLLLERNDRIGGCVRTEAITEPGFIHDVMATTFVLFITSPAYAALAEALGARGVAFAHSKAPTGVLLPDGRSAVLRMDRAANVAAFEALAAGDGAAFAREIDAMGGDFPLIFALLGGRLWSRATAKLLVREAWRRGLRNLGAFFGESLGTARAWLETTFASEEMQALFAPWVLHTGLGPESAYSGQMARVIAFALEAAGAPIVQGGAGKLLAAFESLIADQRGEIRTGADVARILRDDASGAARGVRLASGEEIAAKRGVICSVTPTQLYGRLLDGAALPETVAEGVRRYRYGKGNMQIHYALAAPPRWRTPGLGRWRCCISPPASTAFRARPTRRSAACCRRCRRSASASRPRSTRAARRRDARSCGCNCRKRRAASRATRRASWRRRRTAPGPRRCATATPTAWRRFLPATSMALPRRCCGAWPIRRPIWRR